MPRSETAYFRITAGQRDGGGDIAESQVIGAQASKIVDRRTYDRRALRRHADLGSSPRSYCSAGNDGTQGQLTDVEAYLAAAAQVFAFTIGRVGRSQRSPDRAYSSVCRRGRRGACSPRGCRCRASVLLVGQSAGAAISIVHAHSWWRRRWLRGQQSGSALAAWIEAASEVERRSRSSLGLPDYRGENAKEIDMRANDVVLEALPDSMPSRSCSMRTAAG